MKKFYPVEDKTLDRCISIALAQKRFIHSPLRDAPRLAGIVGSRQ